MSDALAFQYFPYRTWLPSGVNIEFNASNANTAIQPLRVLMIGEAQAPFTVAVPLDQPFLAWSQAQVDAAVGKQSVLAMKYEAYRKQDPFGEVWLGPLAAVTSGVATGAIAISGTATGAGVIPLYIAGQSVPVAVNAGDTAAVIIPTVAWWINNSSRFLIAEAVSGSVSLHPAFGGVLGNDIDVRFAYRGAQAGEVMPPGLTFVITAMNGGAGTPSLVALLANCTTRPFDLIDLPYTDSNSLAAVKNFLGDQAGRWSAETMLYGHAFAAFGGSLADRTSFGSGVNDQHLSVLGFANGPTGSPTPAWLEASDWTAAHMVRLRVNPAQGLTGQVLNLGAPPAPAVDTPGERNVLLGSARLSTFLVGSDNVCRIDRSVTTYKANASGQLDNAYLNTNLLFQAAYAARYINAQLTSMFIDAGKILVSDGAIIGPGSPATTPSHILGAVIAIYGYLCSEFICQNPETFAANARASAGGKGMVLLYLPLDFADQVINIAILAQFTQST